MNPSWLCDLRGASLPCQAGVLSRLEGGAEGIHGVYLGPARPGRPIPPRRHRPGGTKAGRPLAAYLTVHRFGASLHASSTGLGRDSAGHPSGLERVHFAVGEGSFRGWEGPLAGGGRIGGHTFPCQTAKHASVDPNEWERPLRFRTTNLSGRSSNRLSCRRSFYRRGGCSGRHVSCPR